MCERSEYLDANFTSIRINMGYEKKDTIIANAGAALRSLRMNHLEEMGEMIFENW